MAHKQTYSWEQAQFHMKAYNYTKGIPAPLLCFNYCLAFFTAMSPFTYDIVILWLCKWQLTDWVGVNAAVHSVAIGERRKQVVNNINNLISSIPYCFENEIYESKGCNIRTYNMKSDFNCHTSRLTVENKHNSTWKHVIIQKEYQAIFSASLTAWHSVQHCLLLHMTLWKCDYVNDNLQAE